MRLETRIRKMEETLFGNIERRLVVLFKSCEQTEAEVLAERPEIDPQDPKLNIVFVSWFSDSEPGSK